MRHADLGRQITDVQPASADPRCTVCAGSGTTGSSAVCLCVTAQRVYAVCTVQLDRARPGHFLDHRTPLLATSMKLAEQAVRENWADMHETNYDHVVVEPVLLDGMYGGCCAPEERRWFRWSEDAEGYVPCAEPPGFERIVGLSHVAG